MATILIFYPGTGFGWNPLNTFSSLFVKYSPHNYSNLFGRKCYRICQFRTGVIIIVTLLPRSFIVQSCPSECYIAQPPHQYLTGGAIVRLIHRNGIAVIAPAFNRDIVCTGGAAVPYNLCILIHPALIVINQYYFK